MEKPLADTLIAAAHACGTVARHLNPDAARSAAEEISAFADRLGADPKHQAMVLHLKVWVAALSEPPDDLSPSSSDPGPH